MQASVFHSLLKFHSYLCDLGSRTEGRSAPFVPTPTLVATPTTTVVPVSIGRTAVTGVGNLVKWSRVLLAAKELCAIDCHLDTPPSPNLETLIYNHNRSRSREGAVPS